MLVAQITDAYGVVDTASSLDRTVAALNRVCPIPDIAVLIGDLVGLGEAEEYAYLSALLVPPRMPVFVIRGNDDGTSARARASP